MKNFEVEDLIEIYTIKRSLSLIKIISLLVYVYFIYRDQWLI